MAMPSISDLIGDTIRAALGLATDDVDLDKFHPLNARASKRALGHRGPASRGRFRPRTRPAPAPELAAPRPLSAAEVVALDDARLHGEKLDAAYEVCKESGDAWVFPAGEQMRRDARAAGRRQRAARKITRHTA